MTARLPTRQLSSPRGSSPPHPRGSYDDEEEEEAEEEEEDAEDIAPVSFGIGCGLKSAGTQEEEEHQEEIGRRRRRAWTSCWFRWGLAPS